MDFFAISTSSGPRLGLRNGNPNDSSRALAWSSTTAVVQMVMSIPGSRDLSNWISGKMSCSVTPNE
jgi:hypothetical protein